MKKVWNSHQIRPTKNQNCPHGRPVVMYSVPALYETQTYIQEVTQQKREACAEECTFRGDTTCDDSIAELCHIYMEENNWQHPCDVRDGVQLYSNLRNLLCYDLGQ